MRSLLEILGMGVARERSRLPVKLMRADESSFAQPIGEQRWPFAERRIGKIESHAMWAFFEDVQLCRHSRLMQRKIEVNAILGGHSLVLAGGKQERRRSLRRDVKLVRELFEEFRIGIVAEQVSDRAAMGIWSLHR